MTDAGDLWVFTGQGTLDEPKPSGGRPVTRRMLATDLDGTFIGDDDAMRALWRDLDEAGILVVFATGRHLRSIEAFSEQTGTGRKAAGCICMVGTEIWHLDHRTYTRDASWDSVISSDWDRTGIAETLDAIPGLVRQPEEWQSRFKLSYYVEEHAPVVAVQEALADNALSAKVVFSADRFLDVLPRRAGKGAAVAFLAEHHGIEPSQVITAGDTGNDLDMMDPVLGFRSIIVGNATAELRRHQGPGVYHAQRAHAGGIREGLVHFGWLQE